jgi:hypothetical protein
MSHPARDPVVTTGIDGKASGAGPRRAIAGFLTRSIEGAA